MASLAKWGAVNNGHMTVNAHMSVQCNCGVPALAERSPQPALVSALGYPLRARYPVCCGSAVRHQCDRAVLAPSLGVPRRRPRGQRKLTMSDVQCAFAHGEASKIAWRRKAATLYVCPTESTRFMKSSRLCSEDCSPSRRLCQVCSCAPWLSQLVNGRWTDTSASR